MNIGVVSLYMAGEIVVRKPFRLTLEDSLSILIVLVALAGVGYLLTWWQKNRDLAVEAQRLKNAQELEQQRAQDEVFQAYLDQLTEPLISGQLHKAGRFDSVRVLARARTVGVLWKLDPNRKRSLLQSGLHQDRDRVGTRHRHVHRAAAPLPCPGSRAAGRHERLLALHEGRIVRRCLKTFAALWKSSRRSSRELESMS
jgi:hypothetical protein